MKSNYKRLGDYIKEVKIRNTDLSAKELLGINIDKFFMPSVANIIGTDLSKYKVVKKHQFACNRMHVGRDYRIPISLSRSDETFMVSPAYDVFEIKDPNVLDPEFLMMWFSRAEYDRNAWFYTDADIRGGLAWKAFTDMTFPLLSPSEQKSLVAEYKVIQDRIYLNQKLIQKLEETAQAVYKEWFIDFEFPNQNGRPYKSNGGEMTESELGEIPKGWELGCLNDVIELFISKRGKSKSTMDLQQQQSSDFKYPVISAMNVSGNQIVKHHTIPYIDTRDFNDWMNPKLKPDDVLMTSEAPMGETYYLAIYSDFALSQRLFGLRTIKQKVSGWFLYHWLNTSYVKRDLEGRASGTTASGIKLSELKKIRVLIPEQKIDGDFFHRTSVLARVIEQKNKQNQKLLELGNLLLAKMASA